MQYFTPFVPVQQLWPALHEMFPQQKPAETEQNFVPLVFVQQVCPALQKPGAPLSPQHDWPALMQYFAPFVSVQQPCPALQGTLPQQKPPEGVQTGGFADVQHVVPGPQAGEQFAAVARLIPIAPKKTPARRLLTSFSAWRRGIGLARIRAARSNR